MARTLTPERQVLKAWAIQLAQLGMTREKISTVLDTPVTNVKRWLVASPIADALPCIADVHGRIIHNTGVAVHYSSLTPEWKAPDR